MKPLPWEGDMAYCPNCQWREFFPHIMGMHCPKCEVVMDIYGVRVESTGASSVFLHGGFVVTSPIK